MNQTFSIIFIDKNYISDFYPICLTRPFAEINNAIFSFQQRWEKLLNTHTHGYITAEHLQEKYPINDIHQTHIFLDARYFPESHLVEKITSLSPGEALFYDDEMIACLSKWKDYNDFKLKKIKVPQAKKIENIWEIISTLEDYIRFDFDAITKNRKSEAIPESCMSLGEKDIFIEKGACLNYVSLNANNGPIYIGKNSEIMEGSLIRGGFCIGENSKLNMGTKIYGPTVVGAECKIGGEINHSLFCGFANKAHDGFLGHSIIGQWCNLGANTNNSNLKNNYDTVKLYNYTSKKFAPTKQQFLGLIMGDHSKSAISTRFNTGTVVGVSSNVFQNDFPRNFIPSFAWGNNQHGSYEFNKSIDTAQRVMQRRKQILSIEEKNILKHIFDQTEL